MAKTHNNRDGKPSGYRFSLTDDKTHEQLYAGNAAYRKMVDLQKLEEEGGEHNA